MDTRELEALIAQCLKDFYDRRKQALSKIRLRSFLRRKNPYLFRARAIEKASDLIEQLLVAHLQASDETIFGDAFFEPISKIASGGVVSPAPGLDFAVETDRHYLAVAMKSGPNIYNASQKRRQSDEFNQLRARLQKLNKQFDPLLGHAYGRKRTEAGKNQAYRDRSGQAFWTEITGDPDFYVKLIRLMGDEPQRRREEFAAEWDALSNRLAMEFVSDFCFGDGRIDWEKLTQFVSAEEPPKLPRRSISRDES
ncbi:MAG: cytoplasmic protein [Chloroflexi bacterium RBG_16_68_14]|nr:MAG: cytoplasmic protein [Chloroflexi bacterium RBG_16_68_14]